MERSSDELVMRWGRSRRRAITEHSAPKRRSSAVSSSGPYRPAVIGADARLLAPHRPGFAEEVSRFDEGRRRRATHGKSAISWDERCRAPADSLRVGACKIARRHVPLMELAWNGDLKNGARVGTRHRSCGTAVRTRDRLHNGQAQSCTAVRARPGFISA